MSMTQEEGIELVCYGGWLKILMPHLGDDDINRLAEAMCIIGNALRPVSREQVDVVIKSLKFRLENNEESGVVYIPKFAVMEMIERLEAIENGCKMENCQRI